MFSLWFNLISPTISNVPSRETREAPVMTPLLEKKNLYRCNTTVYQQILMRVHNISSVPNIYSFSRYIIME